MTEWKDFQALAGFVVIVAVVADYFGFFDWIRGDR